MMSDLIERLDKLITVGNAWEWESTIQDAITALSPVLPDKELESAIVVYDRERTKLQAQVKAYDKALEEVEILYPRIRNIIRRKRAALQENE